MINLLPTDYRTRLHYGRMNSRLIVWIEVGLLMIAVLALIIGGGRLYMDRQIKNLNSSATATQAQLKSQKFDQVQKQAEQISQNVRTINQVLGREIRFSELMQEVGRLMPPGTVLGSLTVAKVSGAIDLTANTKDYASAAQIAVNLSDPKNNLFTKVDIINVNCSNSTGNKAYPCTATFRALFGATTPSRFVNAPSEAKQ